MPYRHVWVDPDLFLEHNGVKIYHCYNDDDFDIGRRTYWFTANILEGEGTASEFDVRDLAGYTGGDDSIRNAIIAAIDAGEIKAPPEEEP